MFNFKEPTKQFLRNLFEKEVGREMTSEEEQQCLSFLDDNNDYEYEDSDEIKQILRNQTIEEQSHIIRLVIAYYDKLLRSKYPQSAIKYIDEIVQNHNIVLSFLNSDLYTETIEHAQNDMFIGFCKFNSVHNTELKLFFDEYVKNPSLSKIRKVMLDKYGIECPSIP